MKIGLASYRCENRDMQFNIRQIERAMKETRGKADLLCFGEAFLQGFDSLCWDYEKDRHMAVEQSSETILYLRKLTERYGQALLTGYIEKEQDRLYSSCIVLAGGEIVHNYRRVSRGWKEYTRTDFHYCEGEDTEPFELYGKKKNKFDDIVSARAIILTDSLIIWVDQDKVKQSTLRERLRNTTTSRQAFENTKGIVFANRTISGKEIVASLNSQTSFEVKKKDGLAGMVGGKNFVFHFPRNLDAVKPYFSFGKISQREAIYPISVLLNGNTIDVEFEKNNDFASKKETLYVSSAYGVLSFEVTFDENAEPRTISKVLFQ